MHVKENIISGSQRRFYDLPDGRMSALHFGDFSEPPEIVFVNANGFNGLSYRAVLEPLGVHAIALDLRGHGMSELPTDPAALRNWHIFRDDIVHFIERYVDAPIVLAGHSFGAVSGILAAPKLGDKVKAYAGLDPVSMPWLARQFPKLPGGRAAMKRFIPIARNAGRRRFVFENAEAAFERYHGRGAFKSISDQTLRDYLDGGLKPHENGVQLACHPEWEQAIFAAQGHNMFKALGALPENSQLIYGGKAAVSTPSIRVKVQKRLNGGTVIYRKDLHHLFPFQRPDVAIEALQTALNLIPPTL